MMSGIIIVIFACLSVSISTYVPISRSCICMAMLLWSHWVGHHGSSKVCSAFYRGPFLLLVLPEVYTFSILYSESPSWFFKIRVVWGCSSAMFISINHIREGRRLKVGGCMSCAVCTETPLLQAYRPVPGMAQGLPIVFANRSFIL